MMAAAAKNTDATASSASGTVELAHSVEYPRDACVVQPCLGVFGLIGFRGKPEREAEHLAFVERLAPHYGDDW